MKCSNCGHENNEGKFCEDCGLPLATASESPPENIVDQNNSENFDGSLFDGMEDFDIAPKVTKESEHFNENDENESKKKDPDADAALENLKKFEEGTITHPDDKPKQKRKFYCPRNPMLWSFYGFCCSGRFWEYCRYFSLTWILTEPRLFLA